MSHAPSPEPPTPPLRWFPAAGLALPADWITPCLTLLPLVACAKDPVHQQLPAAPGKPRGTSHACHSLVMPDLPGYEGMTLVARAEQVRTRPSPGRVDSYMGANTSRLGIHDYTQPERTGALQQSLSLMPQRLQMSPVQYRAIWYELVNQP